MKPQFTTAQSVVGFGSLQLDRDAIRRNEFGWLLRSQVADLAADGLVPPRFRDLAGSLDAPPAASGSTTAPASPRGDAAASEEEEEAPAAEAAPAASAAAIALEAGAAAAVPVLADSTKRSLLRGWLESRLVGAMAAQAACVAEGLREVLPAGALALLEAPELQALLAGTHRHKTHTRRDTRARPLPAHAVLAHLPSPARVSTMQATVAPLK
jgi:hypothetical protein